MNNKYQVWIVTDIDGTLMDHNYDLSPALGTLNLLKKIGIPVIPCTSKTAKEVRLLRQEISLDDPFIVENGGAIYGDSKNHSKEWRIVLGESFAELRPKLDLISKELGYKLKAFNDLNFEEIESLTGLKNEAIPLAIAREWSVPFITPPDCFKEKLLKIADKYETTIYKGNRMSHLLGKGSHKGNAVIELKKFLKQPNVTIIALGDSQNDIPLLEVADKAIVVPGPNGPNPCFLNSIKNGDYLLAPYAHAKGWALAVSNLIQAL